MHNGERTEGILFSIIEDSFISHLLSFFHIFFKSKPSF